MFSFGVALFALSAGRRWRWRSLSLALAVRAQAERRLYILRDQLKIQFRATQKAQVNERRASDSKRRLTS